MCADHAHACAGARQLQLRANAPNGALAGCDRVSHLRFKKIDGGVKSGPAEPEN